jgi:hypothetical protein
MATAKSLSGKGAHNAWDSVAASATDSVLVAAVAENKIRVTSVVINHGDTTASSVTFNTKGSGAGTAISPALKYPANGGTTGHNPDGWFETLTGEGLTVTTSAGSTTGIIVTYKLLPKKA